MYCLMSKILHLTFEFRMKKCRLHRFLHDVLNFVPETIRCSSCVRTYFFLEINHGEKIMKIKKKIITFFNKNFDKKNCFEMFFHY